LPHLRQFNAFLFRGQSDFKIPRFHLVNIAIKYFEQTGIPRQNQKRSFVKLDLAFSQIFARPQHPGAGASLVRGFFHQKNIRQNRVPGRAKMTPKIFKLVAQPGNFHRRARLQIQQDAVIIRGSLINFANVNVQRFAVFRQKRNVFFFQNDFGRAAFLFCTISAQNHVIPGGFKQNPVFGRRPAGGGRFPAGVLWIGMIHVICF